MIVIHVPFEEEKLKKIDTNATHDIIQRLFREVLFIYTTLLFTTIILNTTHFLGIFSNCTTLLF